MVLFSTTAVRWRGSYKLPLSLREQVRFFQKQCIGFSEVLHEVRVLSVKKFSLWGKFIQNSVFWLLPKLLRLLRLLLLVGCGQLYLRSYQIVGFFIINISGKSQLVSQFFLHGDIRQEKVAPGTTTFSWVWPVVSLI